MTSTSAMESGNSPIWGDCGATTSCLTDVAGFELSASELHVLLSRFGRRPNRDATHTVTSSALSSTMKTY